MERQHADLKLPAPSTVGTRPHTTSRAEAKPDFEAAFREFGLPRVIRTDNGPPFASVGLAGLSELSIWWIRLGIRPERIQPGHPEQNGRHERMHRTLEQETALPPSPTFKQQQAAFDHFRREYNCHRPHEALGQRTPAELYEASAGPLPSTLPEMVRAWCQNSEARPSEVVEVPAL